MRIFTLVVISVFLSLFNLQAQELPAIKIRTIIPKQYQHNFVFFNPAYAGSESKREIGITGHKLSMQEPGGPVNGLVYYHAPSGARELQTGIGVVSSFEKFSPYTRGRFGFVYARGLQLTKNLRVAAGVQVNGKFLNISYEDYRRLNPNGRYLTSDDSDVWPDLDAGIWVNAHPFFLGGSIMNIMSRTFEFKGDASRREMREALLTGGFKIRFGEHYNLTPSVLMQRGLDVETTELTYNATAVLKFLIVGASYRGDHYTQMPWSFNGGLNFGDKVYLVLAASVPDNNYSEIYKHELEANLRVRF
ncbi:membrane protein [Adhaeribacter aerolatus]|uniref:Membrane protein n=1 Tax=Adhaeribacter aerolatus TaxID=670289 RepID=A0A512B1P9_9BACT|nr:PorP/SprF family type IX secretion system membrane protein [Adhaeribacter aerolatus]GEO05880.1 membrane protein [Adhaeribacter aerolatus]